MSGPLHPVIRSSALLGLIAFLGTALLAGVNTLTYERIIEQEEQRVLRQLNETVPSQMFNNDLLADVVQITDEAFFLHPDPVTVYRARLGGQAAAVIMIITAPDGYNGDIRLLVGIDVAGSVLGVRVISHKETPGLGDPIELAKSDWVLGFTGRSLIDPALGEWAVQRDGGVFDQFTGATISPRAVVRAVHRALKYYEANKQIILGLPADPVGDNV